jgi:hypothetical protein
MAIEQTPEGGWRHVQNESDEDREAEWSAVNTYWETMGSTGNSGDLEAPLGPLVARLLLIKGIGRIDAQSRLMLLEAFWKALRDAFEARKRQSMGDYRPNPNADRYPTLAPEPEQRKASENSASHGKRTGLTQLVVDWWKEAEASGLKPSTHESYRNTMAKFVAFLRHDDAGRVSKDDVLNFKEHRLASGVSAKTVRRAAIDPVAGLTVKASKPRKLRQKGFYDVEASAILKHAKDYVPGNEGAKLAAAKRFVPWLQRCNSESHRYQWPRWIVLHGPLHSSTLEFRLACSAT